MIKYIFFLICTIWLQKANTLNCNETTVQALNLTDIFSLEYEAENTTLLNISCTGDTKFMDPDDSGNGILTLSCNENTGDFDFPDSWPECTTKCPVPVPSEESGFQAPAESVLEIGETITYNCNDTESEIGSTMTNSMEFICTFDGLLSPNFTNYICEIPKICGQPPDPDSANSGLVFSTSGSGENVTIKAYRTANYSCNESSLITDEGYDIYLPCLSTGEYETRTEWPECREPVECKELPPLPDSESGLAETTSEVKKEGEDAIYTCSEPEYLVMGAKPEFKLTCGSDGFFPMLSEWPECRDPEATTTSTTTEKPLDPCQCIGDLPIEQTLNLLDKFCRDPEIPGNYDFQKGYTPASRKRCGNRSPENPTKENHCFCSTVEEQAMNSYTFTIALRNEPWQWTYKSGTNEISYLEDSNSALYRDYKIRIEKAIDDVFYNISSIADDYLRAQVVRFYKGNDVPIMQNGQPQIFRNEKPTTTTTTTTPATSTTTTTQPLGNCSGDDLGIPDELSILNATSIVQVVNGTTDNTTVYIGGIITIGCENDEMTLFASDGKLVEGNQITLTCTLDGYTNVPETWPTKCQKIEEKCDIPVPPIYTGIAPQIDGITAPGPGEPLVYICNENNEKIQNTTTNLFQVICGVYPTDVDPFFVLKYDFDVWPQCKEPQNRKRKKRQIIPKQYQYINVVVDVQFKSSNTTEIEDVQQIYVDLANDTDGQLTEDILLEKQYCSNASIDIYCNVTSQEICPWSWVTQDNKLLEDLDDYYEFKTREGIYQKESLTQEEIEAGVTLPPDQPQLIETGDIVEISCAKDSTPPRLPLIDVKDDDPRDQTITAYCMTPSSPNADPRISLRSNEIPKCTPICTDSLPIAPPHTDLELKEVIPISSPKERRNLTSYGNEHKPAYSGDRLVYQCKTDDWGVYGGTDNIHDAFRCTDDGVFNVPLHPEDWPRCSPQQGMVIAAAELMLQRFDRKISDRYKLIGYKEDDFQKEIIYFSSSYFTNVTIPVLLALTMLVFCCCICTRNGSPMCTMCDSKI